MAKPALDLTRLSADEKFDLIDALWQSFTSDDFALTPELRTELDRRLDRIDREGVKGVAWEDLRAEMVPRRP